MAPDRTQQVSLSIPFLLGAFLVPGLAQQGEARRTPPIPAAVASAVRGAANAPSRSGFKTAHRAFFAYQPEHSRGVLVVPGGALYYTPTGSGLVPVEGQELPRASGPGGEGSLCPSVDTQGEFWSLSPTGLHRLKNGAWVRQSQPLPGRLLRPLQWGNALVIDQANVLFVSTEQAMLEILDPATWESKWELPYPTSDDSGRGSSKGLEDQKKPIPSMYMGPELVLVGKRVGIYYQNSGRLFRFDSDTRKVSELEVPWVTWGQDEARRGKHAPSGFHVAGRTLEAEFPLEPFMVPMDGSTVYLIGGLSGFPSRWVTCEFDLEEGGAVDRDLALPPRDQSEAFIHLPTRSGLWMPMEGWLSTTPSTKVN